MNELTGLPHLPDGHYWEIVDGGKYLYVRIMRARNWLPDKVESTWPANKNNISPSLIRTTADLAWKDWKGNPSWKQYVGTYPPKKLEDTTYE